MNKTSEATQAPGASGDVAVAEAAPAPAKAARKPRGRPLSFDRDAALETAMHVFWERGYEAASIADLTAAMGITPPSLYTAFGDKEQLFLEAIERYALGYGSISARALQEEPSARGAVERWLSEAALELTQPCHPKGCMVVMAATNCSAAAERVQDALLLRRTEAIANVGRRIQGAIDSGELPADTDAGDLANFYATIYQGMSMQAKDGATHESLMATVRTAMRSWPRG
jgi:AcrR family transcriptional regulator